MAVLDSSCEERQGSSVLFWEKAAASHHCSSGLGGGLPSAGSLTASVLSPGQIEETWVLLPLPHLALEP